MHTLDDDRLIAELVAPPTPAEARASLAYWERRHRETRVWQRARRREAALRVEHWEREVIRAERTRKAPLTVARGLALVGARPSALRRWGRRLAAMTLAFVAACAALVAAVVEALLG